jgi:two-component system, NarL family, nitrate/nitrite response regulator NarL
MIAPRRGDCLCGQLAKGGPADHPLRGRASFIALTQRVRHGTCVVVRCLLVDDSEAFLASASRFLSAQGLEVVGCASYGAEALHLARQLEPDVVLVDVQLGDEDGLEVTRRLSATAHAPRVILISSHSHDDLAELIADSPAVGFLPKSALNAEAIAGLASAPRGR